MLAPPGKTDYYWVRLKAVWVPDAHMWVRKREPVVDSSAGYAAAGGDDHQPG